jgi:hypothetical protein
VRLLAVCVLALAGCGGSAAQTADRVRRARRLDRARRADPTPSAAYPAVIRDRLHTDTARLKTETSAQVFVGTYYSGTGSAEENRIARRMNALLTGIATAFGPRFHVVDGVPAAFRDHDCRAKDTWMLRWDLCLHPNRAGQRALGGLFAASMEPYF